jgi:hypothetical protein
VLPIWFLIGLIGVCMVLSLSLSRLTSFEGAAERIRGRLRLAPICSEGRQLVALGPACAAAVRLCSHCIGT